MVSEDPNVKIIESLQSKLIQEAASHTDVLEFVHHVDTCGHQMELLPKGMSKTEQADRYLLVDGFRKVNIWRVSFEYAPHIHDNIPLSSPLKGIERKIFQLLPVSEVLYSTDLTDIQCIVSVVVPELVHHLSWMDTTTGNSNPAWIVLMSSIMSSWVMFSSY